MKNLMRQAFADTMLEIGQKDKNLIVLIGDISHFILQPYAQKCPERFYNIGICEPTMVSMAAGLAKIGFYPVVHTISPFIVERSFEQIKDDFGYQKLGVNLITVGSAFDYSDLGCTHHCYDDFALLKTIENMQIFYPATPQEFYFLFKQTYNNGLPKYFRIPKVTHTLQLRPDQIKVGKGITITTGNDLTIIALGPQLTTAVEAATKMRNTANITTEIIYLPTIKPLDQTIIKKSLKKTGRCLVIEEHSVYGGVLDDVLRSTHDLSGIKYAGINVGEKFIHQYGTYQQLCHLLGFSNEGIIQKVQNELFV